jgi:hypothetical protein
MTFGTDIYVLNSQHFLLFLIYVLIMGGVGVSAFCGHANLVQFSKERERG